MPITAQRLALLRLVSQKIVGSDLATPRATARWMLAMQAQDFPGAKWALGLRTPGATNASVEAALTAGEIVRSWPQRGTLHFVPGEDLGWLVALTSERMVRSAARRLEALGLDERTLEHARETARVHLNGRKSLSRNDLLEVWTRAKISVAGQRGYHLLWFLAQTGTLCFGPPRENEQSFVLLDEWAERPRRLAGDEALGELARRYFSSHGPATMKDLAWWTKLTLAEVKRGIALARASLTELHVDGVPYFLAPDTEDRLATLQKEAAEHVAALPGFDEFLLGYQDRRAVLEPEFAALICPGNNGVFLPTIVARGRVSGTWRRAARKSGAVITLTPCVPLAKATVKRFATSIARWATFWNIRAALSD